MNEVLFLNLMTANMAKTISEDVSGKKKTAFQIRYILPHQDAETRQILTTKL